MDAPRRENERQWPHIYIRPAGTHSFESHRVHSSGGGLMRLPAARPRIPRRLKAVCEREN
jgi:hypothetical protein